MIMLNHLCGLESCRRDSSEKFQLTLRKNFERERNSSESFQLSSPSVYDSSFKKLLRQIAEIYKASKGARKENDDGENFVFDYQQVCSSLSKDRPRSVQVETKRRERESSVHMFYNAIAMHRYICIYAPFGRKTVIHGKKLISRR
jgi:hypothetical protein